MTKQYSKKEILKFLRSVSIMSVAINSDEYPISTVLLFSVDEDFTFYFATRNDSYKAKALKKDSKISLSVWEHNKMLVQAHGSASEITDPGQINLTLDSLASSVARISDFWPPVLRIKGGDYSVYKIVPKWIRALDLTSQAIKEEDIPFTEYQL